MASRWRQSQPSLSHKRGRVIAAVGDELGPFAIGDAAVGDGVRVKQGAVARALAIEGEAVGASADLDQPFAPGKEGHRLERATSQGESRSQCGAIDRLGRIFGEGGEDVGQEQFLVLLLMLDPERDQRQRLVGQVGQRARERRIDRPRASRGSRRGWGG